MFTFPYHLFCTIIVNNSVFIRTGSGKDMTIIYCCNSILNYKISSMHGIVLVNINFALINTRHYVSTFTFLLYINNLPACVHNCIKLYADDVLL